ncbi:MAG: glycosyltransferase family 2 protein [Actinobacteria bacterium]|nr:glycosyltransferase family 2 protein [Actinomycetota bacterium]
MIVLEVLFWLCLGLLVWAHGLYPLFAALLARLRPRLVRKSDLTPTVTVIVAAHDEEDVIERRLENLLALDYPAERLEILIASDASTDGTDALVEAFAARDPRIRLLRYERGGKLAAQNRAYREAGGEILAFSDANATWATDALRKLVQNFADPDVAYVCGRLRLQRADGSNREGAYWRYELWVRERESLLGSVTGGNGSICAVRAADYIEHRFGHDLGFPYKMVQRGKRAVYEPEALAFEKPSAEQEDEYRRKVRMFEWCWLTVFQGGMFRQLTPVYWVELVSHRLLRYASGILHLVLLATNVALVREGIVYDLILIAQGLFLALAALGRRRLRIPGASLAYYYTLVTWATVASLVRYARFGVPGVWQRVEGTR